MPSSSPTRLGRCRTRCGRLTWVTTRWPSWTYWSGSTTTWPAKPPGSATDPWPAHRHPPRFWSTPAPRPHCPHPRRPRSPSQTQTIMTARPPVPAGGPLHHHRKCARADHGIDPTPGVSALWAGVCWLCAVDRAWGWVGHGVGRSAPYLAWCGRSAGPWAGEARQRGCVVALGGWGALSGWVGRLGLRLLLVTPHESVDGLRVPGCVRGVRGRRWGQAGVGTRIRVWWSIPVLCQRCW